MFIPATGLLIQAASLYVHIPYCKSRCDYCDFFSTAIGSREGLKGRKRKGELLDGYVDRVIREVADAADKGWFSPLKTVYIGGGTPSLLTAEQIARLTAGIDAKAPFAQAVSPAKAVPSTGSEVTLEANPDDITPAFLRGIADAGITRLSLGIQSLSDASLKAVRRRAGKSRCMDALDCIRSEWRRDFSVDLIAGLPEETPESFIAGLESVVAYRPSHISLYALTLTEGTPLYRRVKSGEITDNDERAEIMWLAGRDFLIQMGYNHYEVSNFAKPHAECAHNMAYWRMDSYAGAGIGAVGSLYSTDGTGFRYTVTADGIETEELGRDTVMFETLMMGFRTREGVASKGFSDRFGVPLEKRIGAENGVFASWEQKGLAERYDAPETEYGICYRLTPEGLLFLNRFLRELCD